MPLGVRYSTIIAPQYYQSKGVFVAESIQYVCYGEIGGGMGDEEIAVTIMNADSQAP
jgi:hypothetical protein